jgi:predicted transcriptional regulator
LRVSDLKVRAGVALLSFNGSKESETDSSTLQIDKRYTNFVYFLNEFQGGKMSITTVNISFSENLLIEIDKIAKKEARSRSELIREASRMYIERKKKWQSIFDYGRKAALKSKIVQEDIMAEIKNFRESK